MKKKIRKYGTKGREIKLKEFESDRVVTAPYCDNANQGNAGQKNRARVEIPSDNEGLNAN